jgi:hypothetical protein
MSEYSGPVEFLDVDGSVVDDGTAELYGDPAEGDSASWFGIITVTPEAARDLIDAPGAVTIRLPSGRTGQVVATRVEGSGEAQVKGQGPAPF